MLRHPGVRRTGRRRGRAGERAPGLAPAAGVSGMSLHLEERGGDDFALFIDGDLQFDTADEALYHESLALPALTLARPPLRSGGRGRGSRVLARSDSGGGRSP